MFFLEHGYTHVQGRICMSLGKSVPVHRLITTALGIAPKNLLILLLILHDPSQFIHHTPGACRATTQARPLGSLGTSRSLAAGFAGLCSTECFKYIAGYNCCEKHVCTPLFTSMYNLAAICRCSLFRPHSLPSDWFRPELIDVTKKS
jgi:hypothetical protein